MKRECETCIKRKTLYCPSTNECMNTDDMPYYQNRIMLLEENEQLKGNWNKLKEIIKKKFVAQGGFTSYEWNDLLNDLLDKMQELEKGSDLYD